MEREHRHLDGEADEECPENPLLQAQRQIELHQFGDFERVGSELAVVAVVQRQDAEQHQYRTGQCVQEKLNRRVEFPRPAPHADDEVHRHQHQFPENVEQEEIERDEYADHSRLQQQEHGVVFLHPLVDGFPRRKNRQESDHRGEHHQQQADAVDADQIFHAERGDPVVALHHLKARSALVEARGERERNHERGEAGKIGPNFDERLIGRRDQQQHGQAGQRGEQYDAQ